MHSQVMCGTWPIMGLEEMAPDLQAASKMVRLELRYFYLIFYHSCVHKGYGLLTQIETHVY